MSDLSKQVIKRFPEQGDMQLVSLRAVTKFECSHCQTTKHAKVLAVVSGDWNRLLCNGCYEKTLTENGGNSPRTRIPAVLRATFPVITLLRVDTKGEL